MKIRLKYAGHVKIWETELCHPTLRDLIEGAAVLFTINSSHTHISLNNQKYFGLEDECKDIGIVSGDTLYVKVVRLFEDIKGIREKETNEAINSVLVESNITLSASNLHKIAILVHTWAQDSQFEFDSQQKGGSLSGTISSDPDASVLRLVYSYINCPEARIALTFYPLGNFIALCGGLVNRNYRCQIHIIPSRYILPVKSSQSISSQLLFKNLIDLSILVKDSIFENLRIRLHSEYCLSPSASLSSLPTLVYDRVFSFLDVRSMCHLLKTCKALSNAVQDANSYWHYHLNKSNPSL